jgi:hypothetical protein
MTSPQFVLGLYLLMGLGLYFWSEPYRPQSAAAFEHCFRANRFVWIVMVLIASCFWPLMLANMAYRLFLAPRKIDKDEDSRS